MYNVFEIIDGEDANKFTLKGDELTFKATAFKARNNATYRVNIRATKVENNIINFFVEAVEKTLTVTVINPNTVILMRLNYLLSKTIIPKRLPEPCAKKAKLPVKPYLLNWKNIESTPIAYSL
ncbi:hypothetical protein BSPWISOXPB_2648 [uncultured Gammaproteobacteria bacterium]|nr:hypothetical protein BSPWISOXPB_2648 [uncultured Gammaproteobacteria bacterium]